MLEFNRQERLLEFEPSSLTVCLVKIDPHAEELVAEFVPQAAWSFQDFVKNVVVNLNLATIAARLDIKPYVKAHQLHYLHAKW
jgi:hypothetical protein